MIHNSSSDPVLIKKISLKIWSLRDEIEARIQDQMDEGEITPEMVEDRVNQLQSEYTKKSNQNPDGTNSNVLQLKSDEDLVASDDNEELESSEVNEELPESTEEDTSVNLESKSNTPPTVDQTVQNVIKISIESPIKLSEEKISKGKTILSEIGMERMFFFSNKAFTEGQSIVIQFCIPKTFIVNADVIYCRPYNIKSRIISQNSYTHRMLIRFNFLKEGERALLRQFIQSIEPDITKSIKKLPNIEADSDEGDFNELDDLGL